MPNITINEVNATTRTPLTTTDANPIAIIGTATKGDIPTGMTYGEPVMCATLDEFTLNFGSTPPSSNYYGVLVAREALMAGNTVLYTRIAKADAIVKSSVEVPGVDKSSPGTSDTANSETKVLKIEAISGGTDGNNLAVELEDSGSEYIVYTFLNSKLVHTGRFSNDIENLKTTISEDGIVFKNSYIQITAIKAGSAYNWTTTLVPAWETTPKSGILAKYALANGADGDNMTGTEINTALTGILNKLTDKSLYDFIMLVTPGLSDFDDVDLPKLYKEFSSQRDDAVCVLDCKRDSTSSEVLIDLGLDEVRESYNQMAVFFPWFTMYSDILGKNVLVPPSMAYVKSFARNQTDGIPCRAVAGPSNSSLTDVISVTDRVGSAISKQLNDQYINPIVYNRNYGYFIDGNNVFNPIAENRTYGQLSIRYTLCYIKKKLDDICYRLSYAANSTIIRTQLQGAISSILDSLKIGQYIFGYKVEIVDSPTDTADGVVHANVSIFPTPALEEFIINLRIVNVEENL